MFAARPGSAVNGYALPFAAAAVADLLAAVSSGLALPPALPRPWPYGTGTVLRCYMRHAESLATAGGGQQWNVGGGE